MMKGMAETRGTSEWTPKSILLLRDYNAGTLVADLIAGVTVGMVALPLAMAFAISSGVSPQSGLYCAVITGFLILHLARHGNSGPAAFTATDNAWLYSDDGLKTIRAALKAGYIETLLDAGAVVTPATCGACIGGHMGVLAADEVCITASTRNFKGRMGDPSARIFMASPATVAASALAGTITSAAEFFEGDVG